MSVDLGTLVNRNGAGSGATLLDNTERFSASFHVGNTEQIAIWVTVAAGNPTNLTNVVYKLYTSHDETSWVQVYTTKATNNTAANSQTITASAGATVPDWLFATSAKLSQYARIGVQATVAGALDADEVATAHVIAG